MKGLLSAIGTALGLTWLLILFLAPTLAVWLASSLVSFHGGPRPLALAAGLALFPVLPVWWELRASRAFKARAARKQFAQPPKRTGRLLDRLAWRTLSLSTLFIAVLLGWFPRTAFSALATRGDWFLQGQQGRWVGPARQVVFASAGALEWLHELANPNPYKQASDRQPVPEDVKPVVAKRGGWKPAVPAPAVVEPEPTVEERWTVGATSWPTADQVSPVVAALRPEDEVSVEAVGRAIAARETEPFARVKALHDWVVTRLDYDLASLQPGQRKPQDAQSVFSSRLAVCEGYARLLVALGKASGDRIVYLTGDVREESGEAAPVGHAWNAAQIDGRWYLIDATWDDPLVDGQVVNQYGNDYLFIPSALAIFDHFPDEARWQLLEAPLSRGDFLRQPLARPTLARDRLTLKQPDRSSLEVDGALELVLDNPRRVFVLATVSPQGQTGQGAECGVSDAAEVHLHCPVGPGQSTARLFTNKARDGRYRSVASLSLRHR